MTNKQISSNPGRGVKKPKVTGQTNEPLQKFGSPDAVLQAENLSTQQKLAILRSWEQDELLLSVADDENMTGGRPSMLAEVKRAIERLTKS